MAHILALLLLNLWEAAKQQQHKENGFRLTGWLRCAEGRTLSAQTTAYAASGG